MHWRAAPFYLVPVTRISSLKNYMSQQNYLKCFGLITISLFVLVGCRAEEQGRVVNYEPGVYKGKPDTRLSAVQRRALRQRSQYPNANEKPADGNTVATRPTGVPSSRDVRKPEVRIDRSKARAILNSRIRFQKGSGI